MKIAVTYKDGEVFQHFGHSEEFKIYDIENNRTISSKVIGTNGKGHGALSQLLSENNIDILICGGIGVGAREALANAGIKLYPGVVGNADKCVEDLLKGTLQYNENTVCNHHHKGSGHTCGENGCTSHSCH